MYSLLTPYGLIPRTLTPRRGRGAHHTSTLHTLPAGTRTQRVTHALHQSNWISVWGKGVRLVCGVWGKGVGPGCKIRVWG